MDVLPSTQPSHMMGTSGTVPGPKAATSRRSGFGAEITNTGGGGGGPPGGASRRAAKPKASSGRGSDLVHSASHRELVMAMEAAVLATTCSPTTAKFKLRSLRASSTTTTDEAGPPPEPPPALSEAAGRASLIESMYADGTISDSERGQMLRALASHGDEELELAGTAAAGPTPEAAPAVEEAGSGEACSAAGAGDGGYESTGEWVGARAELDAGLFASSSGCSRGGSGGGDEYDWILTDTDR
eukprot:SAG22_NODE_1867_length_3405_cov_56.547792_3_plen_243_part_00